MNRGRSWQPWAMLLALSCLLGLVVATAGCGEEASGGGQKQLILAEIDNGKEFTVEIGSTILVRLPGNPTTGYTWTADLDQASAGILRQDGEPDYVADDTSGKLVGGGGIFSFVFVTTPAHKTEKATLRLIYARPWESVPPLEVFEAVITVKS